MEVPWAIQSYRSRSLPVSSQRMVNMYAEAQPSGSKAGMPVFGTPGISLFSTCGTGPVRGVWQMAGVLYVVSGQRLYSVSSAGISTDIGGAILGSGNVSMSDNGTQLCVVNGAQGYIYSVNGGFQLITDPAFNPARTVEFFDTYFVFDWNNTNQFFLSNSLDGTTYNALAYASAEVSPDLVLATVNQQENLLIFGQTTIETWYDSGNVNFPFARYDGATIERGCAAPLCIVKEDNSVFFMGSDLIFYRLNGVVPVRVSTHAIEWAWSRYPTVADATIWTHTWQGHKFLVLTFPTGNATWVYDIATNLWHERISYNAANESMQRWRVSCGLSCYGKILVGDNYSGQIGFLDETVFTEYGNTVKAYMISPAVHSDKKRVFMSRFELDVEAGVGTTTGQGSNPQFMLDYSDDGGRTWSGLQTWDTAGAIGTYRTRLRWLRMGSFRQRVIRLTISDPVVRTVIAAHQDVSVGSA